MARLGEVRCENAVFGTNTWVIPGVAGCSSVAPHSSSSVGNPEVNLSLSCKFDKNPRTVDRRRADISGLFFQMPGSTGRYLVYKFDAHQTSTARSSFSFRMYHTLMSNGIAGANHHLVSFRQSGTNRFSLYLGDYAWMGTGSPFDPYQYTWYQPYVPGLTSRTLNPADSIAANTTWRTEVQVQGSSPKLTIKFYNFDSTTVFKTITCDPASTTCDEFVIGALGGYFQQDSWYNDLEWFDSYNLDGTAGQPYVLRKYTWSEWNGSSESAIATDEGVWNGTSIVTSDKDNINDTYREFYYPTSNWTTETAVDARTDGGYGYNDMDLYIPTRTAPAGGWPVIIWVHGGFFIGGDKNLVPMEFVKQALYRGYAVISANYVLGKALIGLAGISLGTWPADGSGRYPTYLIDIKAVGNYVRRTGRTEGDSSKPFDSSKMAVVGYSAGGYIALGAACSKGLTSFNGVDTTVNNATFGIGAGTSDPTFKCAYAWAGPFNLQKAWDWDPTHPGYGSGRLLGNTTMGTLRVTVNAFFGRSYNTDSRTDAGNTSIPSMINANAANVPPLGFCAGRSDYLVHWEHGDDLIAACTANSKSLTYTDNAGYHDLVGFMYQEAHFFDFLNDSGM